MKQKLAILILLLLCIIVGFFSPSSAVAEESGQPISPDELLSALDYSSLVEYFNGLPDENKALLGGSVEEFLSRSVSGENTISLSNLFECLGESIKSSVIKFLPMTATVIALLICFSLLSGINGELFSKPMEEVVSLGGVLTVSVYVLCQAYYLISSISTFSERISQLSESVFPILLTIISSIGAKTTVGLYSSTVGIFLNVIVSLITNVVIPAAIISLVISIVSSISNVVKLDNTGKFVSDFATGLVRTLFFSFFAFLSVQGIVVNVSDSISMRLSKFALSKYVPIIGGYLSDGFNYLIAGSIVIKNSIGLTAICLLFVEFLPLYFSIVLFNLSLKLTSAIAEPLNQNAVSNFLNKTVKGVSILGVAILGLFFSFVIFVSIIMIGSNVVA